MPNLRIALAASALLLASAAAALPTHPAGAFSLDLSPLHRVSTEPTLQAGTYAAEDPHGTHHRTRPAAHHHSL